MHSGSVFAVPALGRWRPADPRAHWPARVPCTPAQNKQSKERWVVTRHSDSHGRLGRSTCKFTRVHMCPHTYIHLDVGARAHTHPHTHAHPHFLTVSGPSLRPTSPEDSKLLRYSRNASSFISLSVKMKVMPLPSAPATLYKFFKSSIRLLTL